MSDSDGEHIDDEGRIYKGGFPTPFFSNEMPGAVARFGYMGFTRLYERTGPSGCGGAILLIVVIASIFGQPASSQSAVLGNGSANSAASPLPGLLLDLMKWLVLYIGTYFLIFLNLYCGCVVLMFVFSVSRRVPLLIEMTIKKKDEWRGWVLLLCSYITSFASIVALIQSFLSAAAHPFPSLGFWEFDNLVKAFVSASMQGKAVLFQDPMFNSIDTIFLTFILHC